MPRNENCSWVDPSATTYSARNIYGPCVNGFQYKSRIRWYRVFTFTCLAAWGADFLLPLFDDCVCVGILGILHQVPRDPLRYLWSSIFALQSNSIHLAQQFCCMRFVAGCHLGVLLIVNCCTNALQAALLQCFGRLPRLSLSIVKSCHHVKSKGKGRLLA